jgi:hypothetical protein
MAIRRRLFGAPLLAISVCALGACTPSVTNRATGAPPSSGGPVATAGPSAIAAPGIRGRDWGTAAVVEPPPGIPGATLTPYENSNSLGHPQHYQGGQANLLDVAGSDGLLVAVGYLARDFSAAMWWSPDGRAWTLAADIPADEFSRANGVAISRGIVVATGASGHDAAVWTSVDGRTWTALESDSFAADTDIRMTTVVASDDGFIAAGYVGTLAGPIRAAFWTSPDGTSWQRVPDGPAFEGARVTGLAVAGDGSGLVAVGVSGDAQHVTDAVAWRSADGTSWTRSADSPSMHDVLMNAVTAAGADGFVAVGTDVRSVRAVSWTSADGDSWEQAPDAPALDNFGLKVEMRDVTTADVGFVAGGHVLFGTQFPAAALWTSDDGVTWTRALDSPALSDGRVEGVVAARPQLVAVGSIGSPDFSIPTVWLSPPS